MTPAPSAPLAALPPSAAAALLQPAKFVFPAAGVAVRPAATPIEGALVHVAPLVMQDAATQRIIVFSGHLANLADLAGSDAEQSDDDGDDDGGDDDDDAHHGLYHEHVLNSHPDEDESGLADARGSPASARRPPSHPQHLSVSPSAGGAPTAAAARISSGGAGVGVGGSVGVRGSGDKVARLTTGTLLQLYDKLGAGKELLMLSELQGEFAFVILDANKKASCRARGGACGSARACVGGAIYRRRVAAAVTLGRVRHAQVSFAARDPSGENRRPGAAVFPVRSPSLPPAHPQYAAVKRVPAVRARRRGGAVLLPGRGRRAHVHQQPGRADARPGQAALAARAAGALCRRQGARAHAGAPRPRHARTGATRRRKPRTVRAVPSALLLCACVPLRACCRSTR